MMKKSALTIATLLIAGCTGTFGGPPSYVPAATNALRAAAPEQTVTFALSGSPATTRLGRAVRLLVISPEGSSHRATIKVSAAGCTSNCGTQLKAPATTHVFTVDAYDGKNKLLSRTWIYSAFQEGPYISMTLASSVSSVTIGSDNASPAFGKPATVRLFVMAQASTLSAGSIVVGPGEYSQPISLTASSALHGMALSTTAVHSAAQPPPVLRYDGKYSSAAITARVGRSNSTAIVAPMLPVSAVPVRSNDREAITNIVAAGNYLWTTGGNSFAATAYRIAEDGTTQGFVLSNKILFPGGLAGAPDGSLWYGACKDTFTPKPGQPGIVHVTTSGASFFSNDQPACSGLAWGRSGDLWFIADGVQKISPQGTITNVFKTPALQYYTSLAFSKDGSFWGVAEFLRVGGALTHFSQSGKVLMATKELYGSVFGNGSNLIFANSLQTSEALDVIDSRTGKAIASYNTKLDPWLSPLIAGGSVTPDGAFWCNISASPGYGYLDSGHLGRIDAKGNLTVLSVPTSVAVPSSGSPIAVTSDGALWYTATTNDVYKVTLP